MDEEERLTTLEAELPITTEELKQILLDIRTFVMDAQTPIPNDLEREKFEAFCAQGELEKREALQARSKSAKQEASQAQSDPEKGVETDGK